MCLTKKNYVVRVVFVKNPGLQRESVEPNRDIHATTYGDAIHQAYYAIEEILKRELKSGLNFHHCYAYLQATDATGALIYYWPLGTRDEIVEGFDPAKERMEREEAELLRGVREETPGSHLPVGMDN